MQRMILLFLISIFVITGCASQSNTTHQDTTGHETDSVLRIGVNTDYPPVIFKENNIITGIEADLAKKLANDMGVKINFVNMDWDKLIDSLNKGDIDIIMSGMSITEDRKQYVNFTEPYLRVGQMALIRSKDIHRLSPPQKMFVYKSRVGFVNNTTGESFVRKQLANSELKGYVTVQEGVNALRSGAIDYFIHDAPTIWRYTMFGTDNDLFGFYKPLTEEYLAWAVRKSDTELLEELNDQLSGWKEDRSLDSVLNKWIKVSIEVK